MAIYADNKTLLLSDTATNDSDKTFTVPAGDRYRVLSGNINLITTATVGNRQLDVQFRDDANVVLFTIRAGAVQAASVTRDYKIIPGAPRESAFVAAEIVLDNMPLDMILDSGYDIRVFDSAAVDAAADDMVVHIVVQDINHRM